MLLPRLDRALLATYLRPEWPRAVLLGVLLFAGIGLQLANPQIARTFIDHAQAGEPFERLVWIALLFIGVALLTQVATVAETYVAEDLGWRTTNALRADLTRHVLELDASFHAEHGAGELIERIDGDVSAIADFFARFVVQVLGSARVPARRARPAVPRGLARRRAADALRAGRARLHDPRRRLRRPSARGLPARPPPT